MKIILEGRTYDVDPQPLIAQLEAAITDLQHSPEFGTLVGPIRAVAGTVLGALAMRRPELRRPDGVDTLTHAARLLASAVEAYLEAHPLELAIREATEDA